MLLIISCYRPYHQKLTQGLRARSKAGDRVVLDLANTPLLAVLAYRDRQRAHRDAALLALALCALHASWCGHFLE